jgi:hypothetical protein
LQDKELIEAALFAAGGPVTDAQLKALLNRSVAYVSGLVDQVIEDYRARSSPLEIIRLDGKYVMQLKPEFAGKLCGIVFGRVIDQNDFIGASGRNIIKCHFECFFSIIGGHDNNGFTFFFHNWFSLCFQHCFHWPKLQN